MIALLLPPFLAFLSCLPLPLAALQEPPPTPSVQIPESTLQEPEVATQATVQEPEVATQGTPSEAQPAANDPAAERFLAAMVAAQRATAELPAVSAFEMKIHLRDFDASGAREADVVLAYHPDLGELLMSIADSARAGAKVEKGFDAEGYWLRQEDGSLVDLGPREYQQDRAAIDESIDLCGDFLLLFDFERLQKRATGLRLAKGEKGTELSGQLRRGRESWTFRLGVRAGQELPERLLLQAPPPPPKKGAEESLPPPPPPPPQLFSFGDYRNFDGRLLPGFIDQMRSFEPLDPLRSFEIRSFVWRDTARIQTRR